VKLDRADKLIGGLGGEKIRWQATVEQLEADLINVVGDVVVAAGTIAYSGPFTPVYRADLLAEWAEMMERLNIPHTPGTNIIKTLQDPVQVSGGRPPLYEPCHIPCHFPRFHSLSHTLTLAPLSDTLTLNVGSLFDQGVWRYGGGCLADDAGVFQ
jgi:hypothetical protein